MHRDTLPKVPGARRYGVSSSDTVSPFSTPTPTNIAFVAEQYVAELPNINLIFLNAINLANHVGHTPDFSVLEPRLRVPPLPPGYDCFSSPPLDGDQ